VENTPLAVIEFDTNLFIKRWSKRAEEIFGWETSEALGKNVYDADFPIIYAGDTSAVGTVNEELTKGKVNWNLSLNRNYTKGGNVIYCEWYNSVLKDEHDGVITILSLVHDVTERKKSEEKLRQANKELHNLSIHLQNVREEERTAIAREIHDELGQQLTGLKMDVLWVEKRIATKEKAVVEKISDMITLINETVKSVRRISTELRPSILDDLGLIAALEWQAQEFQKRRGIQSVFVANSDNLSIDSNLATAVFRVYQETLTNVARHADATIVETTLEESDEFVTLTVKDNGIGFDPNQVQMKNSLGLIGMKERVLLFRGELTIESSKTKGTLIILRVPLIFKSNIQS
jgi:PAS domain S-box-containing protein